MTSEASAPDSTASARGLRRGVHGAEVELDATPTALSGVCACCLAPASRSLALVRSHTSALIVPYCAGCHAHAAAFTTRVFAVTLASSLLGLTLALSLPLLLPWLALGAALALVSVGSLCPLAFALLFRGRARPGHTVAWRAVWWVHKNALFCAEPRFAAALSPSGKLRKKTRSEPALSLWMCIGPIIGLCVAAPLHRMLHPLVRIVNLSPERLAVSVDGRHLAWIAPTSAESPAAGTELRVPAGERRMTAKDATGQTVEEVSVRVVGGAMHFYAPASVGYCFWLEHTRYGRAKGPDTGLVPLGGDVRFWVLARRVDTWFSPNPPPADDERSTGGSLTALRQAPCGAAPRGDWSGRGE